jgi:hypothetical protein
MPLGGMTIPLWWNDNITLVLSLLCKIAIPTYISETQLCYIICSKERLRSVRSPMDGTGHSLE